MAIPKKLDPGFSEFVGLLNKHDVQYLVVGGYAVGFHGHARYTKDLNLWIQADDANADRIITVLREFGFGSLDLAAVDFPKPSQIIQIGREPVRIDLLTSVKGLDFASAASQAITVTVGGVDYRVVSLEDLNTAKSAAGRPQDLADIDTLSRPEVSGKPAD